MNKTLQQLAYRNVKKYKKHYLFVSILIFCVSVFFLSYTMIFNNQYDAKKTYNQDKYGEWYCQTNLTLTQKDLFEKEVKSNYGDFFKSYYIYNQGKIDDYKIGYVDQEIYDFCRLELKEGKYPELEDEIMISTTFKQDKQLNINDNIKLNINNVEKDYKIVGIIENSQDNLFLDIYTCLSYVEDVELVSNLEIYSMYLDNEYIYFNFELNEYGYEAGAKGRMSMTYEQLAILAEALILTIFALLALNSTSLKRRSKEFALLRGIGMTNKQLFAMVMYEIIYTVLVSIVLALIFSFGVNYIGSIVLEKIYGVLVYNINFQQLCLYTLFLVSIILVSMMYPIYSSSKNSLSGTFDSQKFQHIQVRYKKLKYQSKLRLALRELNVHKKMTISLSLILAILSLIYMTSLINGESLKSWGENHHLFESFHYYESYATEKEIELVKNNFDNLEIFKSDFNNIVYFENKEYTLDVDIISLNDSIEKHCNVEGRLPQKDNEVLLGSSDIGLLQEVEEDGISFREEVDTLSLNDSFKIKDREYIVVGVLLPNETKAVGGYMDQFSLYYAPNGIYVKENEFDLLDEDLSSYYTYRIYFDDELEREEIYNKYKELFPEYGLIYSDEDLELAYGLPTDLLLDIDPQLLILPVLVGFIFLYYLNKNHILNNSQDIALSKLIGMTNKDLFIKQLCKALIITIGLTLFNIFWIFMLNVYYNIKFIPILEFVFNISIVFVVTALIYCLPLKDILKNNVFDLIKGDE